MFFDQLQRFQRKGGKCRKAAAETRLEKEYGIRPSSPSGRPPRATTIPMMTAPVKFVRNVISGKSPSKRTHTHQIPADGADGSPCSDDQTLCNHTSSSPRFLLFTSHLPDIFRFLIFSSIPRISRFSPFFSRFSLLSAFSREIYRFFLPVSYGIPTPSLPFSEEFPHPSVFLGNIVK